MRVRILFTSFTIALILGFAGFAHAHPNGSQLLSTLDALTKRVIKLERRQAATVGFNRCGPKAVRQQFNRARGGQVLNLSVSCLSASSYIFDGGFEVAQDLDPSFALPVTGNSIPARVLLQTYVDTNDDYTPDKFVLSVVADEDYWVSISAYCCQKR